MSRIGMFWLLWLWVATATASPQVIVTVDVESTDNLPLSSQVDMVCAASRKCGLSEITRVLDQHHAAGTFFLNVYEYKHLGEDELRSIARRLEDGGHDVALHTHPHWAYDFKRPYMYQYTLDEQTRIVAEGVQLLEKWTGKAVVAHRAGAYSANRDTLEALTRNRIPFDYSYFPSSPTCRLDGLGLAVNAPGAFATVTEIPVTVYERHERPALVQWLPPHVSIGKLDVNAMDDERQAAAAIAAVAAANPTYIVLFLHSFSLMAIPAHEGDAPPVNERSMKIFNTLMDEVTARHLTVVTSREIAGQAPPTVASAQTAGSRALPRADLVVPPLKYVVRMARSYPMPLSIVALFAACCVGWLLVRRRRPAVSLVRDE